MTPLELVEAARVLRLRLERPGLTLNVAQQRTCRRIKARWRLARIRSRRADRLAVEWVAMWLAREGEQQKQRERFQGRRARWAAR